ncbi:MAG: SprT family zinc-dependent metalloprotease [Hyphomicrobiales bacterium]
MVSRAAHPVSSIEAGGLDVAVAIRYDERARRLILRMNPAHDGVVVTLPPGIPRVKGIAFARHKKDWIAARARMVATSVAFAHNAIIPVRGQPHRIVRRPGRRNAIGRENAPDTMAQLVVHGDERRLAQHVRHWLKTEARHDLARASHRYGAAMGLAYRRLVIRDQKSRWGSCSSLGTLSYSWRLILAPPEILNSVAAHEVAHLAHMNHGPKFQALVHRYCPRADEYRLWLRENGPRLHGYGWDTALGSRTAGKQ